MKIIVRKVSSLILCLLMLQGFFMITQVARASPKSLYLVANHHTRQFDAWEIKPDGTATYQATYWLSYATDPAGIAIDESSNTLFITSEFSGGVEIVDATTMTSLGVSPGPSDLAGIDVDDANDVVYAVKRYSNNLYVYDWDPVAKSLTPRPGFNPYYLPGCLGAFGIALDEIRGILWVADSAAGIARAYDVNTWVEDTTMSFAPSHKPVDIAVDRMRGYVYTVSMSAGAWVPPGCGSRLLSKYDIRTRTEVTGSLPDQGVGVAVDEVTGFVYITLSPYGRGLSQGDLIVLDTSTTPWTQIQMVKVSGSPAGICIPQEEVAYNPLGLTKDDGLAEGEYIYPAFGKIGSAFPSLDDHPLHQLPATSGKISWFSSKECRSPGFWEEWLGETPPPEEPPLPPPSWWTKSEDEWKEWWRNSWPEMFSRWQQDYGAQFWYCALRFPKSEGDWWHNKKVLVTKNNKQVVLAVKDFGPAEWTGKVIDVSKTALDVLGAETGDVVNIAFADQNAKLGPVENDVIIYKIYYDNTKNNIDVHNVRITDTLPAEVSFISTITSSGSYDPSTHTVTWNIGTLPAWATRQCVHLVVRIYPTVEPGSTIINYATIDSDETPPTTVSEVTDVGPLPGEIGLLVDVIPDKYSCNKGDDIKFEVSVTNPTAATGVNVNAYYVKLSVIEPEEIDIYVPTGGISIAKISPGESKSTTFYGKAIKGGDNVEVIVNAWGYTDLTEEAGKIRGRGSCTITIHDPEAPKPDWSFAIITDLHIGYNSERWDSDNDGYVIGEIDYASAGWDDAGPYDSETIKRMDYEVTQNLENAVDKIIAEKGPYNIKFVVVLGDISDTAEKSEFLKAREILNRLNDPDGDGNTDDGIPYIPLFGNHDAWPYVQDIQGADDRSRYAGNLTSPYIAPYAKGDEFFKDIFWGESNTKNKELIIKTFGDSWEYTYDKPVHIEAVPKARKVLGKIIGECCGFKFLPCSKELPDGVNTYYDKDHIEPAIFECDYYLQNYGFTYGGITFVCLDLVPRLGADINPMNGNALPGTERGSIATDHPETLKFSKDYISKHNPVESKKIVFFSHYPIGPSVLNYIPLGLFGYDIYGFFGHIHVTGSYSIPIVEYLSPISTLPLPVASYIYHGISTEDVAGILPESLPAPIAELLKTLGKRMDYGRTGKTIRIVKVTRHKIDYSTILKPNTVEIRWPFPDFVYTYASYPEPNKEITFTAYYTTYYGFKTSFQWDFGDGSYGYGPSVTHSYVADGEYNVTLQVTTENLMTSEKRTYTITRPIYVHTKHVISSLSPFLSATSWLTGEDLTQIPKNTYQPVLISKKASEDIPIAQLGVHFEVATEDVDFSTLVADVNLEEGKSVIYMPSWPEEIEDYKTLFIPSTGAGTVYICLDARSLDEVSLENADLIINVGEVKDNITVTTTFYNGREYYLVSGVTGAGGGELKDTIPPTTTLTIGEPKYVDPSGDIYVSSATPFILTAQDNIGGSGVMATFYRISNETYSTNWLTYTKPFNLTGMADGAYRIEYKSIDKAGNEETPSSAIVILHNAPPVVSFTWSPSKPKVGEAVTFDASASTSNGVAIVSYEWEFGDGGHATGKIVTHTYTIPGMYTVKLNVTNALGFCSIEQKQIQIEAQKITINLDIDPDTLNLKSKGKWITAYIELPEGYNISDIDVSSILLNGTIPMDPNAPTAIGDYDNDGIPDLMVKFNRTSVCEFILSKGIMFGNVTLTVSGKLINEIEFEGCDTIRVRMPGDINMDGKVDMKDISILCRAFGSYPGHSRWNPTADENEDNKIDIFDIALTCRNYGKIYK